MTKYAGIDYGLGKANVSSTGHRYGVISINSLHEFIYDELELEYGDPCCPECGHNVEPSSYGKDYFCDHCFDRNDPRENGEESREDHENFCYWSDSVFGDEPVGQYIDNSEYSAHDSFDNTCLFITRSPYYTFASFCSPCAPGAGDLDNPNSEGVKTLCFGHEMFEGNKAPYPVYRVIDDSLVKPVEE